ncbi:MAG: two-component sensor histidine kinase, partial [Flavobacterium sp.]|nr:two-component sensor histidine kinase [Flavobacterium sp.]
MNDFKISMLSLRIRIFLSMILLILISSIIMASISIYQFKNEAKIYHQEKLDRKEVAIKENIDYVLSNSNYSLTSGNLN